MIIILIFNEDFFYQSILETDDESIIDSVIENKSKSYHSIDVHRKGKLRAIKCIQREHELYQFQRNLLNNFLSKIPLPDNVCGFVKNRSYRHFLMPHIWEADKNRYYLRLDIKDFFDSIDEVKIRESLTEYITINNEKVNEKIINTIIGLATLDGCLPQGGVTSPALSNLVFRRLDVRIRDYCRKLDVTYTRYADDLLFSSKNERIFDGFFTKMMVNILKSKNFILNRKKLKRGISEISLNGFVVGRNIRISRSKKKDITNFLYVYRKGGIPTSINDLISRLQSTKFYFREHDFKTKYNIINYLAGYRSMLIDWLPEEVSDPFYKDVKKLLEEINIILKRVENLP